MVYIEYGNDARDAMKTKPMTMAQAKKKIEQYKEQYWFADIRDCNTDEKVYE